MYFILKDGRGDMKVSHRSIGSLVRRGIIAVSHRKGEPVELPASPEEPAPGLPAPRKVPQILSFAS